jgi:hypothetical protein
MTMTSEAISEIGAAWVDAELAADIDTLDPLVTDDFRLVGPFGFVLDKQQWLDRYRGLQHDDAGMARHQRPRVRRQRRHDRHAVATSVLQGLAVERRLPHHARVRTRWQQLEDRLHAAEPDRPTARTHPTGGPAVMTVALDHVILPTTELERIRSMRTRRTTEASATLMPVERAPQSDAVGGHLCTEVSDRHL